MTQTKTHKKAPLPCPAWVYSINSNVHVAKDRCWFADDYVPFDSYITSVIGGRAKVIGVGTVHLPTQTSYNYPDPHTSDTLTLKNVLHVPDNLCNIIGPQLSKDYKIDTKITHLIVNRATGNHVANFKYQVAGFARYELQLCRPPSGPLLGPSPFDTFTTYAINAIWLPTEQQRFMAAKLAANGPLTVSEGAWVEKHYESERKFLLVYGLNVSKEDDRAEGRAILRATMAHTKGGASAED